jgi:hypothetical protein
MIRSNLGETLWFSGSIAGDRTILKKISASSRTAFSARGPENIFMFNKMSVDYRALRVFISPTGLLNFLILQLCLWSTLHGGKEELFIHYVVRKGSTVEREKEIMGTSERKSLLKTFTTFWV